VGAVFVNAGLKAERQRRIARLLAQHAVTSQQELVGLLATTGQPATQATVSRDLEELGAYKVRRNGHVVYALPAGTAPGSVPGPGGDSLRRLLAGSVGDVETSGNIVIVHTPPGYAGMVASAVDRAGMDGIAGTVAGDDTILVVCRHGVPGRTVELRLRQLAGLETKQLQSRGGKR
jgi:transcriptional regulator of arginine metabolism